MEYHVLHYLHNLCPTNEMKKITLLQVQLTIKIIPECPRLGYSFFTHISVFGTVNKDVGECLSIFLRGTSFPVFFTWEKYYMVGLHLFTLETNQTNRVKKIIRCCSDMEPCKLVSLICPSWCRWLGGAKMRYSTQHQEGCIKAFYKIWNTALWQV